MSVESFVLADNYNLFRGAQTTQGHAQQQKKELRLKVSVFDKLVASFIGPSKPFMQLVFCEQKKGTVSEEWAKHDYVVKKPNRTRAKCGLGNPKISASDDYASIIRSMVNTASTYASRKICVIGSGGGGLLLDGMTMPQFAELLLMQGWQVVLLAWPSCTNHVYYILRMRFPLLTLVPLDMYRATLVYAVPKFVITRPSVFEKTVAYCEKSKDRFKEKQCRDSVCLPGFKLPLFTTLLCD